MLHDIFKDYISKPIDSRYREIKKYSSVISTKQAVADLDEIFYITDNRYSGKDYWQRQGINFEKIYSNIKSFVESKEEIYISDFCREIHRCFDVGIVDSHFSFASPLTGRLHFIKKYSAYFAKIIVEKSDNRFIVIKSEDSSVKANDIVNDSDCLYPTLSPSGKYYYLVGCRSWVNQNSMKLKVNGKVCIVSLHKCKADSISEAGDICLRQSVIDNIPIIRSNCCDYVPPLKSDNIINIGRRYKDYDLVIWNNLSNEGGYSKIPHDFLLGLNNYVCCEEYSAKLISPVTENKDCKREWILTDSDIIEREKGTYNGTLYFLMNSDTASSGETSILYSKSLRNSIFIGENSMGCNTFGNIASYQLTNSNIIMRVPNMINLCKNPDDCIEGKGFSPDYWVDNTDVQSEVIRWLRNNDTFSPTFN